MHTYSQNAAAEMLHSNNTLNSFANSDEVLQCEMDTDMFKYNNFIHRNHLNIIKPKKKKSCRQFKCFCSPGQGSQIY
jgi:hypothetical protein